MNACIQFRKSAITIYTQYNIFPLKCFYIPFLIKLGIKWFYVNYLKDLQKDKIQYCIFVALLMNSRYHFFFLCGKGMQLTASLVSQAVPSVSWIRGLESPYPTSIPVLEFVSLLLYRNIYLHWHDLSKAKKETHIPLWRGLSQNLEVLFHVHLLSENLVWLINHIISNMPHTQAWLVLLFDIFYYVFSKSIQFILTSKVNMALLILEMPLSYP